MIKKINFNGEKQIEYEYNQIGQLIQMKDWLGITNLELDPLGRILKVTDYENKEIEYTWTATGEKESITYPDGSKVYYEYDKLGRLTKVEDEYGKITTYEYDELSNLIERILPNGSTTQYKYNQISNITELKEIDPLGRITDTLRYEYDRAGNKTKAYKNRSDLDEEKEEGEEREQITYTYDAIDQLIEVTRNNETKKYFYDTLGNRVRMEEWKIDQVEEAINYEYDSLNRLIRTYEDIEEDEGKQYGYDNRGNLTQERSGGKIFNKYEYDETNSLIKVTNKQGDQTKYTYDGFGNRIKTIIDLNHPGGGNRPDKDDNGNNGNNGNAYGHENGNNGNAYGHDKDKGNPKPGWKHQNKRQIMEQNFVVDITSPYNNVLMIYGDHYQIQRYTYGIDRISMDMWMLDDYDNGWIPSTRDTHLKEDPERLYYLHDELGSTTKVIGENGKTSAHYNYDEFGRPLSSRKFDQNWPGPDNTFGYTGYQYDVSSDLYYAQARYYNAEIGRFISEDPWKGTIVEPNTMNPYPYVLNNPLKYVDPLGLRNMAEGGSGAKSTPAPIVNTKPKQNVVNQVKEQVVKEETRGASSWSCNIVNDGIQSSKKILNMFKDYVLGTLIGLDNSMFFGGAQFVIGDREYPDTLSYRAGKVAGDIISIYIGGTIVAVGSVGKAGGLTLSATGAGAILGIPLSIVSVAAVAYGSAVVANGTVNFYMDAKDLIDFAKSGKVPSSGAGGSNNRKGETFRGGKQSSRDQWYGYNDKDFQRWWHRQGKKDFGGGDILDKEMAKEAYELWLEIGKPKVK